MYNFSEKIIQYLKKLENEQTPVQNERKTQTEKEDSRKLTVESIKELNDTLSGKVNSVELKEMEFNPLTDQEIKRQASEKVDKKYEQKANLLENKKNANVRNLEIENEQLQNSVKGKKDEIETAYKELEQTVGENAIKRGISRSSIVSEQVRSLGVEKIRDLLGVDEKIAGEIKKNSDKIKTLEQDYSNAIESLSIDKAVEISDIIDKLKKEQKETLEKVLKYNNDIKKQQATLNQKEVSLTNAEKANIKSKIVSLALDYYNSLPKDERLLAFEADDEMLNLLGDNAKLVENYLRAMA